MYVWSRTYSKGNNREYKHYRLWCWNMLLISWRSWCIHALNDTTPSLFKMSRRVTSTVCPLKTGFTVYIDNQDRKMFTFTHLRWNFQSPLRYTWNINTMLASFREDIGHEQNKLINCVVARSALRHTTRWKNKIGAIGAILSLFRIYKICYQDVLVNLIYFPYKIIQDLEFQKMYIPWTKKMFEYYNTVYRPHRPHPPPPIFKPDLCTSQKWLKWCGEKRWYQ